MCGIAGIYNHRHHGTDPIPVLQEMLARIRYRGPDESGIYCDDLVGMGSVRLSIIDISTGQQPLSGGSERYWIVFNGEIFNYIELRSQLLSKGHVFQTDSDTEVLLHVFMEYGPTGFNMLNGQFAVAIWDKQLKRMILARDRLGIRPLFYTWQGGTLVFGSEIKVLKEYPGVSLQMDPKGLSQVFTFWTTLSPRTIFEGVAELSPGHYMLLEEGRMQIHPWWRLRFPKHEDDVFKGSFEEARENLGYLLKDAVRLRLRSDVPVGAYLSGGLDSTTTTALMKEISPENLTTFSIGFEDGEFDETGYQQEASIYLKTNHKHFYCSREEIGASFPDVVWHSEIPILRTAPVPMYLLSRKVRESGIKVVMTGEGADEMLSGYDIFKETVIRHFWSRQPDSSLRPLLFKKLYPYIPQLSNLNQSFLKFFFGYQLEKVDSPFYSHLLRWHNTARIKGYFSEDLKNRLQDYDPVADAFTILDEGFDKWDPIARAQWLEISLFMSGYLLSSQGDRVAMAHSVEGRYPFLDYRLVEFAASLPADFKMKGLNEKYILKKVMEGRIPDSILKRSKQAYRAPITQSFQSEQHRYVDVLLSKDALKTSGLFDESAVSILLKKIDEGRSISETDHMAFAGILSAQILQNLFIHGNNGDFIKSGVLENTRIINHTANKS